ncbi:hypothetical protein BO86DRAFT_213471 [Aspergillus japonicus CBS 114.51]|uniref:Uncharacterized protein n=2 Tax=Aspergillus TaxID=5052 RepID=A0A2V5IGC4_ASPV1|nr:hypothetical protein BO86DRAFT_213471 [Aspergillus japonicus CBS 114.51]PYI22967.1 hypothetical protein BO99DRAFT_242766 [Aspergillus violaceofuscus CBS 115571]RAH85119.1 hypothetical protein BO86DRAFT_213471 [Aspergillus japonicus CBS 114.51]
MAGVQLQQPSMTDYRLPIHQPPPARKPVAGMQSGFPYQSYEGAHHHQLAPHPSTAAIAHNRRRTSSSHVFPYTGQQQQHSTGPSPHHSMTAAAPYPPSRRLSSATTSTSSTGNNPNMYYSGNVSDIRRSTSSRSANAQLGYVALMRRQKATVWCDRAQPEDPRLRAQKLVDKKRAYLEVHGAGAGRTGTLGSGKNKHGAKGGTDFSPSALVGATVPVRLSANEVGDADEDAHSDRGFPYRRTGSGRSSLGSNSRYPSGYQRSTVGSSGSPSNEMSDLPDVSEHPRAETAEAEPEHASIKDNASLNSLGSEPEDKFGTLADMAAPSAAQAAIEKAKKADELRRRGSVDDRTTSMTNVRLFVANPDLSD